ncbi:PD-(D/E)XK nuclease-like domain-containing protein [Salmonella enterica]|uniref:PD-(D/E)XK nuclease-like domain-containing protein n=5 Tax=Salmonella enterica TaxID=28901 RepID=UPI000D5832FA|nr:PD-(D/E)XK nuclease-like domain-containing protein [Salmonella enterica]EGC9572368.1 exonuclease VIII [Salmonella enterica subsp. enterica serovar Montevideo]EAV6547555.1 exonuclease VIII [Salmonella enterica]EBD0383941.1 exonuclease VIII [Salmonella enterica]EEF5709197.1 exonuclease VIII [Salmonella enterica]EFS6250944.1 exonuclease VIII [Salmonella enterica]
MSENKEDFALHCPVKNEEARKRLGIKAGFFWATAKKLSVAVSRCIAAMDDKGYDEDDFKKPVRVNLPVVNDLPPEGVFDTEFCNRYEKGGDDGKTMMLIPGAVPADQFHGEAVENAAITSDTPVTNTGTDSDDTDGDTLPAYAYNVNGEPMEEVLKEADVSVATLPFIQRFLHLFYYGAGRTADWKGLHWASAVQRRSVTRAEMDQDDKYIQNLLPVIRSVPELDKLDNYTMSKLANAIQLVFHPSKKAPQPYEFKSLVTAWWEAEPVDRGLLVKEWQKGNRISRIETATKSEQGTSAQSPEPKVQKTPTTEVAVTARPRRGEKPTHRTINYELACGFCEELDLNNLRPAMDFAKRIIAEDREDWKRMSMTVGIIPDIKGYDRQTIIDLVRKAPKAVHNGNPDLRRMWCESFLAVHGVRDPDWYEYVPDNTPTTHEENAARLRQAGKCLRDIEAGRFQCDEEKQQPTGELADEPATPEAVEQDTTEHHPDPQPLENESPVSQTEAGYQKIRAELHEARKNIPPKNPVDVGKQLAAARGEYVEGISDPNDPKWVHNNYSASNQGEKEEVVPEEKQPAAEPEAVTRNADGTFDVSALFSAPSNQIEKMEARTERDGETPKESNQRETAGDTGQEITTDGGSGTGGDEAGEAADPVENGNFTVPDDIQPGIYYDIPNEAYHAGPGVSKSQLDDIADTPAIYLWRKNAPVDTEKTKSLDTGTAFHCRVLEPEEFSKRFIIAPEFNRRTSAGKEEEKTFLEECARTGITVLTAEEGRKIELMYQSVMALPLGQWLVESGGYAESSVYWEDPETGILCRCRPDKIIPEFHWIMDVKTTADIQRFRTAYYDYRYHVQDAFYSDGYRAQFGEIPTFVFLVASTTAECGRYPVEIFMMGEDAKLAGQREYRRNLQTLAECLNNDEWPAIKTLSLPRWAKENANA